VTDAMIVSKSEIVGMTPRKIIRGNAPIARNDLDKPVMVQRGELVTMNLNSGAIKITALAKALEAGTKGDIIRLMNIDSKRTIEAKITGTRTATVLF
jgi:flagella basal body P-ring formation protein FlgA